MATPLFNTRDRLGIHIRTNNADVTELFSIQTVPNTAYQVDLHLTGFTVSGAALPAAYAYWRRALFVTNGAGVITQVGATQTPAADLESDAGATLDIAISGTTVVGTISASFPTEWVVTSDIMITDQINQ